MMWTLDQEGRELFAHGLGWNLLSLALWRGEFAGVKTEVQNWCGNFALVLQKGYRKLRGLADASPSAWVCGGSFLLVELQKGYRKLRELADASPSA